MSEPEPRASSTTPHRFVRKQRGKFPSRDDFLTDDEIRDRELAKVQQMKVDTNVKARRLAIMQEHRSMMEQANAMTRNPRRRVINATSRRSSEGVPRDGEDLRQVEGQARLLRDREQVRQGQEHGREGAVGLQEGWPPLMSSLEKRMSKADLLEAIGRKLTKAQLQKLNDALTAGHMVIPGGDEALNDGSPQEEEQ